MNKETFVHYVNKLINYDNRTRDIEEALGCGSLYDGFIGHMSDDYCELLLIAAFPNIAKNPPDAYYEQFWNSIIFGGDSPEEFWAEWSTYNNE